MKYNTIILFFSIMYASCVTFLIPMDDSILDRTNYLIYAESSLMIVNRYLNEGILALFFNEPIWLLINIILSSFLEPQNTLRTIIFFSSFSVSFLLLRSNSQYFWILLIILIFPNVIKNFIIHLRQGLAMAIFLIGWFSLSKSKRYFFFALSPLVHASFFIVGILYFLTAMLEKMKFTFDIKVIIYIVIGLFISFGLGFIASLLGMRQANEYQFTAASSSGLGFLFWLMILLIYISNGKEFLRKNSFISGMIVFYLVTYFFVEVSARVFESAVILVLLASLELKLKQKYIVFSMVVCFTLLSYVLRLDQKFLGFGL